MAHVAKYNKGAMGHMLSHYDRSKDNISGNIDIEKTKNNYNLASHQDKKQLDFIHERLSQVRIQNRKDVNVLCDWVVTAPKDLPAEENNQFFKETYKFLENQYGKDNVISSYVHMDETTPHMHFAFIPVVEDKKRDGYKVSAKEAITRNYLKSFHDELSKHLERSLSHEVSILNEATKEGNKSIAELKRQSAKERLQEATQKASRIVSKAQEEVVKLEGDISQHNQVKKSLEGEIEHMRGIIKPVGEVKKKKTITGKEQVIMSESDYNILLAHKVDSIQLKKENNELRSDNKKLQQKTKQLDGYKKDKYNYTHFSRMVDMYFRQYPELKDSFDKFYDAYKKALETKKMEENLKNNPSMENWKEIIKSERSKLQSNQHTENKIQTRNEKSKER